MRASPPTRAASETDFGAEKVRSRPGRWRILPSLPRRPSSVPVPSGTLPSSTARKSVRIDRPVETELLRALAEPGARLPVFRIVLRVVAVILVVARALGGRAEAPDREHVSPSRAGRSLFRRLRRLPCVRPVPAPSARACPARLPEAPMPARRRDSGSTSSGAFNAGSPTGSGSSPAAVSGSGARSSSPCHGTAPIPLSRLAASLSPLPGQGASLPPPGAAPTASPSPGPAMSMPSSAGPAGAASSSRATNRAAAAGRSTYLRLDRGDREGAGELQIAVEIGGAA